MAGLVRQTPASIGYVELVYALQNKIGYGAVQNQAGEFVNPDVKSVTAAAAGAMPTMPKDFRVSITNSPGQGAYPISSFTWILLYEIAGRQGERGGDERLHEVGARRRTADGGRRSAMRRCPKRSSPMELEQLNRIKVQ